MAVIGIQRKRICVKTTIAYKKEEQEEEMVVVVRRWRRWRRRAYQRRSDRRSTSNHTPNNWMRCKRRNPTSQLNTFPQQRDNLKRSKNKKRKEGAGAGKILLIAMIIREGDKEVARKGGK